MRILSPLLLIKFSDGVLQYVGGGGGCTLVLFDLLRCGASHPKSSFLLSMVSTTGRSQGLGTHFSRCVQDVSGPA